MKRLRRSATTAIQWALGLFLIFKSLLLAFSEGAIAEFAESGYPDWIRLVLAWSEIAAASLFLFPKTFRIGSWLLLGVLFGAALLHILLGESPLTMFLYMVIVFMILLYRNDEP